MESLPFIGWDLFNSVILHTMRSILFINRVYPPANGATGRVLEHVAQEFVHAGWDVSVLTTSVFGEPAGTGVRDGVRIIRCETGFSKRNLLSRTLGYALMIPMFGLRALLLPKVDVIVIKTDPPMLLILAPLLRFLKGSRLIHWAQDLYPEVAEEAGVLRRGGVVAELFRKFSTHSLLSCDAIVAVGRCMVERIVLRGIPREMIRMIPNTGMEKEITPVDHANNPFRQRHGLGGDFVVGYSGNMGRVHDFATMLAVAEQLKEMGEDSILFLLIGEGPGEPLLRREVRERGLANVRFLPSQPLGDLSESLAAADLHLVSMREGMSGLVVPSKFYGVMAAERPCLFIGPPESEIAHMIREHGSGTVIQNGDSGALLAAILSYRTSPQKCVEEGKNGRLSLLKGDARGLFVSVASEVIKVTK